LTAFLRVAQSLHGFVMMCRSFALLLLALLAGCAVSVPPQSCIPAAPMTLFVVDRGWHTELGIPVEALSGPAEWFRTAFPGARTLMVGYGKKTFITAPADNISEYILGPLPGPAVIQISALNVSPDQVYPRSSMVALSLSTEGAAALSRTLWADLVLNDAGHPYLVTAATGNTSLFYQAVSYYNFGHTCNAWTAELLHAAGEPVTPDGVVLASQVMHRSVGAAALQCAASRS